MLRKIIIPLLAVIAVIVIAKPASAATTSIDAEIRKIAFPTERAVTFEDSFGDARTGHSHEGIDMMGTKMTSLYAAVDGMVAEVEIPEASWGYAIVLRDADGYTYHYLHVNNDTPGTDDGDGGTEHAYAPGIERGAVVTKGQLIGWMGDSGNAENVGSHLHFEIRMPDHTAINPYPSLMAIGTNINFDVKIALASSPDINADKNLIAGAETPPCVSGSLVKSASSTAVYFCGANGKRFVFPNDKIYFTWYGDFKTVTTITNEELAAIPLGGNVTYRPGSRMVKIESLPNVYAVEKGGVLRWIKSPDVAQTLYGDGWKKKVDDISDAFFGNYTFGDDIVAE
jgi:hypothetical protein